MAQTETTLRQAAVQRSGILTDIALIAAGALLVAAVAQIRIPLPFTPVPITGQTFGVLLVGTALGAWRGTSSMLLYVLLGAVGLPVYAGADGGLEVVWGATGGYLLGFIVAGWLVGLLAERGWDRHFRSSVTIMLSGNVVIYLVGLPWLAWVAGTGLETTLQQGFYPFIVGDVVKLYLASLLLPGAWRFVGRLRG